MIGLWLAIAGLGGLASVAAGAAAVHLANDPHATELLRTGTVYGMTHAAALVAVAAARERRTGLALGIAGWGFAAGIVLFSFSLFALALGGPGWLGLVTPFGGVGLLVGWLAVAFSAWRRG